MDTAGVFQHQVGGSAMRRALLMLPFTAASQGHPPLHLCTAAEELQLMVAEERDADWIIKLLVLEQFVVQLLTGIIWQRSDVQLTV